MTPRRIALLVAIFIVTLLAAFSQDSAAPSSYSFKPGGARALAELLAELGRDVERFRQPLTELQQQGILLVIEPSEAIAFGEIEDWLKEGNRAVVLGSVTAASALRQLSNGQARFSEAELSYAEEVLGSGTRSEETQCHTSAGVDCGAVLRVQRSAGIHLESDELQPVLTQGGRVLVARYPVGKGEVLGVFSANLILNEFIDKFDHLSLILALLDGQGAVYIDEFHHGYLPEVSSEDQLLFHSFLLFCCTLSLLAIWFVLGRSIRLSVPRPAAEDNGSTIELTQAMAMMLFETQTNEGLRGYASAWKERVGAVYGASARHSTSDFFAVLDRAGVVKNEGVQQALALIENVEGRTSHELANAITDLEQYAEELRHGNE